MQSSWLSIRYSLTLFMVVLVLQLGFSQGWVPAKEGLASKQNEVSNGNGFQLRFMGNGPLGKDWIYGRYLDEDSLHRVVAHREGGTWVRLPFYFSQSSTASDIGMYGDTLYIIGSFWDVYDEKNGIWLPPTQVIKWYNDSVWINYPITLVTGVTSAMSVKGDSIIISGESYYNPPQLIGIHFMSTDGGATWQYPYSVVHPTDTTPDFGPLSRLQILDNGDILTVNNGSPPSTPYNGVVRWDGQQWHAYGNGIKSPSWVNDFEFYKGDLYMSGTFSTHIHSDDPGKLIARWDGAQWQDVGGGLEGFSAADFFVDKGVLYCTNFGYNETDTNIRYGDVTIPYLAGWDGHQWCGTPIYLPITPVSFGVVNDTLFAAFYQQAGILNGDSSVYMMYFDGDYLHGPGSICSTPGLGEEEVSVTGSEVKIFPNPAGDIVHITWTGDKEITQIKLTDLKGRLLLKKDCPEHAEPTTLDISGISSGVYIIEINGQYAEQLVKY